MHKFRVRASGATNIVGGTTGLTDTQKARFAELTARANGEGKPLTVNMSDELRQLNYKFNHPELPEGARTFCQKWYKEQLYSRREVFSSKYTEKGNAMEDGAIDLVADHFNYGLISKNEKWFDNEYIHGTPDLILSDRIIDIKCSWSAFTFPLFDKVNTTYDIQMQCYMALTGKQMAEVVYCLMDAPEKLIDSEARKQAWALGLDEVPIDLYEQVKADMTYSHLPNHLRIKSFEVKRNDAIIESIYQRVRECREYIDTIQIKEPLQQVA